MKDFKFKKGQKVIVADCSESNLKEGDRVSIIDIDAGVTYFPYLVEAKNGETEWMRESQLRAVEEVTESKKNALRFKKGDKVVVTNHVTTEFKLNEVVTITDVDKASSILTYRVTNGVFAQWMKSSALSSVKEAIQNSTKVFKFKVGDKAIVANSYIGCTFKIGESVIVMQMGEDSLTYPYLVTNGQVTKWVKESELAPVENLRESPDEPMLFVRLFDGMWESNVQGLVVVHEGFHQPVETTGRLIAVNGDFIYLDDQETYSYEKALEVLNETTILQVEIPLSKGKLIVNKNSVTFKK